MKPLLVIEKSVLIRGGRVLATGVDGGAYQLGFLNVIASNGGGGDHVSVSMASRCPTWDEMAMVKECFFADDECAFQLHPPKADYVNVHPFVLHIWRPQYDRILMPPKWMV